MKAITLELGSERGDKDATAPVTECQAILESGRRCSKEGQPTLLTGQYAYYCFPHRRLLRSARQEAQSKPWAGYVSRGP